MRTTKRATRRDEDRREFEPQSSEQATDKYINICEGEKKTEKAQ